jgi:type I restriction enzyme, S subunit
VIDGLKPYPAYQDSGVRWLGEIPTHWEVTPIGRIGTLMKGSGGTKADDSINGVPCIRYGDLYTRHEFFIRSTRSFVTQERSAEYTPVSYGDVLFAGSGETIEEIGKSAVSLITSRACCGGDVLLLRPTHEVVPGFLGYASDCDPSVHQKAIMGRGVTVMHIYADRLKYLWLPFPPLPEQAAIVRFLDHADWRIRRYIAAKKKLIALLNEQKQAIIHRAVTRGLDPNVQLKPSGVESLADVPAHWEVRRGKFVFSCVDVRSNTGKEELLTVSSRDGVVPRAGRNITMFMAASYVGHKLCWPGDLVVNSLWAWARGLGFARDHGIVSTAYGVYRLRDEYQGLWRYLDLLLRSDAYDWQFNVRSQGIWKSRLQLTDASFLDMPIVLPPVDEAEALVDYVGKATEGLDAAISHASGEIALLHEYRTRLIADVVTGKLDVRDAATGLPDEFEQIEPLGDVDAPPEGEGSEDEAALDTETGEIEG